MVPQHPLSFRWPQAVEDQKPVSDIGGEIDGPGQKRRGIPVQIAGGPGVNRLAGEIIFSGIGDHKIHMERGRRNFDTIGTVIGGRCCHGRPESTMAAGVDRRQGVGRQ